MLLCISLPLPAKWEIFARPGIDFFGDGKGFSLNAGIQSDSFLLPEPWIPSAAFFFSTAEVSGITVRDSGVNLGLGYGLYSGSGDLRLSPGMQLGFTKSLVEVFEVKTVDGWGITLTPFFSADYPLKLSFGSSDWIRNHMRFGLTIGYSFNINSEFYHHLFLDVIISVSL